MSIVSRAGLTKSKSGKIGPISEPHNGRLLNSDTPRVGGPISASAIGRQDFNVDTAPEAARRREVRRHDVEGLRIEGEKEGEDTANEETLKEKINQGHEAWREGDDIIIEDEQGEVIHTICSPRKHELQMVVDKFGKAAMERVGRAEDEVVEEAEGITGRLKRMWSGRRDSSDRGKKATDLERGIPEDNDYEMSEKQRISNESSKGASKLSPPRATSGPIFMVDEDNRRMRHASDTIERRAREERDKETEVERRRREAVFGTSKNSDDEDGPYHRPAVSRNKGKQPESASDDENDGQDSPDETSRSQSSSGRGESSGSGAQLLSPPPIRAREIRFGEINVGQESFSLEEGPPSTGARQHKTGSGDWRARRRSDNK
jgi:Alkali metal cation/H+ antiporter Nha1 C terminus